MKKRNLSHSDLNSGAFGLGCNRMIDPDNADMVKVANTAIDIGMNQFDGADSYGQGRAEQFFGKILNPRRKEVIIVSKFGVVQTPNGPGINVTPEYAKQACEASLKRLNMETIDLYYMHRMDPKVPIEDTIGAMIDLKKAGKIRTIGLCNTTPELIRRAHKVHPISAVQMEYSLMERSVEQAVLPTCKELGITFVAYGPLTYSFLSGEVQKQDDLKNDMFRRRQSRFTDEAIAQNLKMLDTLNAVAKEADATPIQVSLAWLMHRPYDILPIPGSSKSHHLMENAKAADLKLTPEQVQRLDTTFAPGAAKGSGAPVPQA